MSRWRVMEPAIRLSALVTALSLIITLWIQPLCYRALRDTLENVRTDLLATMVRPGQFTHPAPGVTVYAQSLDEDGTIHNLFIDRRLESGRDSTSTARDGRLQTTRDPPMLVMHHGANQEYSATGVLTYLSFDDYSLDLRPMMTTNSEVRYKLSDRYLHELVFPDLRQDWDKANVGPMLAEANSRLSAPLHNIAFMFLALTAVIGGGFSRMGYGARIAVVAGVAVVTRTLGFAVQAAAGAHGVLNLLQFGLPVLVSVACAWILFRTKSKSARTRGEASRASRPAPMALAT
jgi:lipopolysaccharide export system permease protein